MMDTKRKFPVKTALVSSEFRAPVITAEDLQKAAALPIK